MKRFTAEDAEDAEVSQRRLESCTLRNLCVLRVLCGEV